MANVFTRLGQNTQRPHTAVLSWDSPQAHMLEAWFPAQVGVPLCDLVRGYTLRPTAAGRLGMSPAMMAGGTMYRWTTAGDGVEMAAPSVLQRALPISVAAWIVQADNPDGNCAIFGVAHNNTDTSPWCSYQLHFTGDGFEQYAFYGNSAGAFTSLSSGIAWNGANYFTRLVHLCVTLSSTATRIYVNGVQANSGAAISNPTYAASATLAAGSSVGVTRNPALGFLDGRIWSKELTPDDVYALYAPQTRWDLYWQPSPRVYVFLGAASGYTPDVAALTIAGLAAGLQHQINLPDEA